MKSPYVLTAPAKARLSKWDASTEAARKGKAYSIFVIIPAVPRLITPDIPDAVVNISPNAERSKDRELYKFLQKNWESPSDQEAPYTLGQSSDAGSANLQESEGIFSVRRTAQDDFFLRYDNSKEKELRLGKGSMNNPNIRRLMEYFPNNNAKEMPEWSKELITMGEKTIDSLLANDSKKASVCPNLIFLIDGKLSGDIAPHCLSTYRKNIVEALNKQEKLSKGQKGGKGSKKTAQADPVGLAITIPGHGNPFSIGGATGAPERITPQDFASQFVDILTSADVPPGTCSLQIGFRTCNAGAPREGISFPQVAGPNDDPNLQHLIANTSYLGIVGRSLAAQMPNKRLAVDGPIGWMAQLQSQTGALVSPVKYPPPGVSRKFSDTAVTLTKEKNSSAIVISAPSVASLRSWNWGIPRFSENELDVNPAMQGGQGPWRSADRGGSSSDGAKLPVGKSTTPASQTELRFRAIQTGKSKQLVRRNSSNHR